MFEARPGESEDQRRERVRRMIAEDQAKQSRTGAQQRDGFKFSEFDPPGFDRNPSK